MADSAFERLEEAPRCATTGLWSVVALIGGLTLGAGAASVAWFFAVYNARGTLVPADPDAVTINDYPDTDCYFPYKGVAGVLEYVGDGRILYVSNCHNLFVLHDVDGADIAHTPVAADLASLTTSDDTLKFGAFDAARQKAYVSFFRNLGGGCVGMWLAVCAMGALNGSAPTASCAVLFDTAATDTACGAMNLHAVGAQLMSTGAELLLTAGDLLQEPSQAQSDSGFWGKVWRAPLGTEPLARADWVMVSKGHRNPQGLCPIGGDATRVLETEHGPMGGDELNVLDLNAAAPANYGWPAVSYGDHYGGRLIPDTHAPDYAEPIAFFPFNLVGSHGIGVCEAYDDYYLLGSLNGNYLYTLVLGAATHRVARLSAVDIGRRVRGIAKLDDCAALLLTERSDSEQGPLVRVNTCNRNRLFGDPLFI